MKITKSQLTAIIKEELSKRKALNEAEEVKFSEIKPDKQKQIQAIEKVIEGKHTQIWDGIHGMIVYIKTSTLYPNYRFEADVMKRLLALKVRWVEADGKEVSVGF